MYAHRPKHCITWKFMPNTHYCNGFTPGRCLRGLWGWRCSGIWWLLEERWLSPEGRRERRREVRKGGREGGREEGLDYNSTMAGKIGFEYIGSIYLLVEVKSNIGNPLCILLHLLWKPSWCDMAHEDTLVDGSVSGEWGRKRVLGERDWEMGQREGNGEEERGSRRMREKEMTSVLLSWYLIRIGSVENKTKQKNKNKQTNKQKFPIRGTIC